MTTSPRSLPLKTHLKPQIVACAAGLVVVIGTVGALWPRVSGVVLSGVLVSAAIAAVALVYAGWTAWQMAIKTAIEETLRTTVTQL
jgi:hypothetical protein